MEAAVYHVASGDIPAFVTSEEEVEVEGKKSKEKIYTLLVLGVPTNSIVENVRKGKEAGEWEPL